MTDVLICTSRQISSTGIVSRASGNKGQVHSAREDVDLYKKSIYPDALGKGQVVRTGLIHKPVYQGQNPSAATIWLL